MKWTRSEKADRNFRDARTGGKARGGRGGGRGGAAAGVGGMSLIGIILALLFGGDWFSFLTTDVQEFWVDEFRANNIRYEEASLTIFDTPIRTGCGAAEAAIGPHYCPVDKGIYLEPGFFDEILARRFGASGDFAQAYVVAHEFGHHVQGELGISAWVRQQQSSTRSQQDRNEFSVRLELQADCLAGVWARTAEDRGLLTRLGRTTPAMV